MCNNVALSSTTDATDLQSVSDILKKLDLDNVDFTTEQKLNALCLIFKETVAENVRYLINSCIWVFKKYVTLRF